MKEHPTPISLKLHLDPAFVPVVLAFIEGSAHVFGLDSRESAKLRLACEEVFVYLCRAGTGRPVTVETENRFYYVKVQFLFEPFHFDPYAFNLTARISPDSDQMDDMGMIIASRSVEGFHIVHNLREGLALVLLKEKSYPETLPPKQESVPLVSFAVRTPDGEILKRFVRSAAGAYDTFSFPSLYRFPGKVVDMVASGEFHALVATGTGRHAWCIGGGILWRNVGRGMTEFFGPYLFGQPLSRDIARGLVDHFLSRVGKSEASFVVGRYITPDLPEGYFELLGTITFNAPSGAARPWAFHYRELKEDLGCQVWAHGELTPFLRREYGRLFLPREILSTSWEGERRHPHSVFAVKFDWQEHSATLSPVWEGEDADSNLTDHVRLLKGEGIRNLFFHLDVGQPWQSVLAPALFKNGFEPVLLMPRAGQADIVVFQHK